MLFVTMVLAKKEPMLLLKFRPGLIVLNCATLWVQDFATIIKLYKHVKSYVAVVTNALLSLMLKVGLL